MKSGFVFLLLATFILDELPGRGQSTSTPSSPTQTAPLLVSVDPTSTNFQYINNYAYTVVNAPYALSLVSQAVGEGGASDGINSFTNNGDINIAEGNGAALVQPLNIQSIGADNNAGNGGAAGAINATNLGSVTATGTFSLGLNVFAVQTMGGSGPTSGGQDGGLAGAVTVKNQGALLAGTSSSSIQGTAKFSLINALSQGGNAGDNPNGYDGANSSSVVVNNSGALTGYWHSTDSTGKDVVYGLFAGSTGGTGGDVGSDAATGKDGGAGGNAGPVTVNQSGNIVLVGDSNTSSQLESGAGLAAVSTGGNGGTGGIGDTDNPSYGGNGGSASVGSGISVQVTNSSIQVTGDYLGGILAQNIGGHGGNGGLQVDHAIAGNGGSTGNVSVNYSPQQPGTYYLTTDGIKANAIEAGNTGGKGGRTYLYTPDFGGVVGNGGDGGSAGSTAVTLTQTLVLSTDGNESAGIVAYSIGGNGGRAGERSADGASGATGNGGLGGTANLVTVEMNSGVTISTLGSDSTGILAVSMGGRGGKGGNFKGIGFDGQAGNGGAGGNGGDVSVATGIGASITTVGDNSIGILALSLSGAGGRGGRIEQGFSGTAGAGGAGGSTGTIMVDNQGTIVTQGVSSYGIFAQGSSGAGGGAGAGSALTYTDPNSGGSSGEVGAISITNSGSITTSGDAAYGIFGMSLSGNGGAGSQAESDIHSVGGTGGVAGDAGALSLLFSGSTTTNGDLAHAILLQSIGGGGGDGGDSAGVVAIGGSGSGGGAGGAVTANLTSGTITTNGEQSIALLAQSIGGGGGNGGNATVNSGVALAIGGTSDAGGGDAGAVTISSGANITTTNTKSIGIVAQSIGGGGGNGGAGYALSVGPDLSAAVALGGTGTAGGNGGEVSITTTGGTIQTGMFSTPSMPTNALPVDAIGILAQSVGGGGGNGGSAWAESVAIGIPTETGTQFSASVAYSAGGGGGAAGNGNTVQVDLGGGTQVMTQGQGSHGVLAQSIGGGGGNGGDSSATAATVQYSRVSFGQSKGLNTTTQTYSLTAAVTLGGAGGAAGTGGDASITLGDLTGQADSVTTDGDYANALTAQSIGGGGGNAGVGSGTTAAFGSSRSSSTTLVLGSSGAGGGDGGNATVTLDENGTVVTHGSEALGVVAQSIGGGGGMSEGGMISLSGSFTLAVFTGDDAPHFNSIDPSGTLNVTLGIQGGSGGAGGTASATIDGSIVTYGGESFGVLVQSIGGGGGLAGAAGSDASADNPLTGVENRRAFGTALGEGYVPFSASASLNVGSLSDGDGGSGGIATANVNGIIQTLGDWASAVVVQSIGGGGGVGGSADATGSEAVMQLGMKVGGATGTGGAVSVNLSEARIVTGATSPGSGFSAFGILAQSIGGGGGLGADGSDSATGTIAIGGGSTVGIGDGGTVNLTGTASIITFGEAAHGVVLQSIGAGGGIGGAGSSQMVDADQLVTVSFSPSVFSSGNGGVITATGLDLGIQTYGDNAFGLLAQSIGGGGGLAAVVDPRFENSNGSSIVLNSGGAVDIGLVNGTSIVTRGLNAYGVFAQSVGGGGGIAGYSTSTNWGLDPGGGGKWDGTGGEVNVTLAQGAAVTTMGDGAHGIVAQSVGEGGGLVYEGGILYFGSTASLGTNAGGAVTVDVEGSVNVSGSGAIGVLAQSTGGDQQGGNIGVTVGGRVVSAGTAIYISDGNQNTVTISANGLVQGDTAVDNKSTHTLILDNAGTLKGSVLGAFSLVPDSLIALNNTGLFLTGSTVQADVLNTGTMQIGTGTKPFEQTEITGNFTQKSGGELVFDTDFLGLHADFLTIDGNVTFDGKLRPVFTSLLSSVQLPVMQITGTVTGQLTVASSSLFNFTFTHDESNTYYIEAVSTNFKALSIGLTPNQQAIAQHFDHLWKRANNPLAGNIFADLDSALNARPNGLAGILDQFSPVNFANFTGSTAFNNTSFVTQQFDDYLADHRGADGTFVSSAGGIDYSGLTVNDPDYLSGLQMVHSRLLAWNPAPSTGLLSDSSLSLGGVSMTDNKAMAHVQPENPWNVFVAGNAILAQGFSDPSVGTAHSDQTTGAVQLGADYRITSHFLVGAMFGYGHTDATLDNLGSSATVDTYSPGIYASYADGGWYANALGSYGFSNYDQDRHVSVGALSGTASSSPSGYQVVGNLDGGYDFHRGAWTFGPTAGLQYVHLDVNSFTETGLPGADLSVNENQADSLRSRFGGRVNYVMQTGGVTLVPHLSASWQHEFLDQSRGVTSQFDGIGGGSFSVKTSAPSRDSALVEVGLDAQLDKSWTVFANYTVQAGQDNYFGQSIQAGVKVGF